MSLRPVALLASLLILALAPLAARADDPDRPPPLSPADALREFRVAPGLAVELVASEPLVVDPVAIDFGPDGRLWVCEMHDYPMGEDGQYTPGGRIKILEDTDGDGRYDRATLFLDGLPFPTGVMAWRRGALVCAAPQVLYVEDTDGDGRADRREVVCEGFGTDHYQARVNSLYLGLDNWLYGASGLRGERITVRASGKIIDVGSRDFRMRPDLAELEPAAGRTQHGRARDDWDNHFGNTNSSLLQHYPLPEWAVARNPHVAPPAPFVFVPRDPDNSRVYPASRTLARFNDLHAANRVTSACSPAIYRDTLLGTEYAGNAFICEPVHNLVTRQVLTPDGVTFAGHRAAEEQDREFLASTDNWFRPAQVRTGPDGALYVVDMYRFVIEHPRWISPGQLAKLDVRAGDDKGRIYRIVREGEPLRAVPDLTRLATPDLVAALDSPNGPLRDNVHRLLLERKDSAAAEPLMALVRESERPEVRVQALAVLDGLDSLPAELLLAALDDADPRVRRLAARWIGAHLEDDPRFGPALAGCADDPEIIVRFEAALSLGAWDDPAAGAALGRIALADPADAWVRAAVLSSAATRPAEILSTVLDGAQARDAAPPTALVGPLVATAAAMASPEEVSAVVATLTAPLPDGSLPPWRLSALADLLASRRVAGDRAMRELLDDRLGPARKAARALARDDRAGSSDRVAALSLLGRATGDMTEVMDLVAGLIDPRQPAEVATAAVRALDRLGGARAPALLLERWADLGPAIRAAILEALLARPAGMRALLEAVQRGELPPGDLDATARGRLLDAGEESVRELAATVLEAARPAERREVLATYTAALADHQPNPERGAALFEQHCVTCHQLDGKGHAVGPDLAELTDRSTEALLIAVLDPNRDIDGRYLAYNAALVDGRVLNGLIASESGSALILKAQDGQEQVVLRSELEALRSTGQSLMPEGLESDLPPADLADLLAYVAAGGAAPKSLPGNDPRVIQQAADGTIRLPAESAEVYGPTLTFETEYGNLGYWQSADDRAAWSFVVETPGLYTLSLEWACPDDLAGNAFFAVVDGHPRRNLVAGTGSWSEYGSIFIGESRLEPGPHRLEIRPDGPPRSALFDLKAVTLTPIR